VEQKFSARCVLQDEFERRLSSFEFFFCRKLQGDYSALAERADLPGVTVALPARSQQTTRFNVHSSQPGIVEIA
jgi:hypothetical protein